jgi:hypothetical protein
MTIPPSASPIDLSVQLGNLEPKKKVLQPETQAGVLVEM